MAVPPTMILVLGRMRREANSSPLVMVPYSESRGGRLRLRESPLIAQRPPSSCEDRPDYAGRSSGGKGTISPKGALKALNGPHGPGAPGPPSRAGKGEWARHRCDGPTRCCCVLLVRAHHV